MAYLDGLALRIPYSIPYSSKSSLELLDVDSDDKFIRSGGRDILFFLLLKAWYQLVSVSILIILAWKNWKFE